MPPSGKSRRKRREGRLSRKLRDTVLVAGSRALVALVPRLPLGLCQWLGDVIGALGTVLPGRRRSRIVDHVATAFPEGTLEKKERARIHCGAYQSLLKLFFEALWAPAWTERQDHRMKVSTPRAWEEIKDYLARPGQKGLVVYTAHLGTFELIGRWFCRELGRPVLAVASRPKIPAMETMLRDLRERAGYKLVYRGEAGLATMRHLRTGGVVVMLVDHNLKGPGVDIPVFGRPAHTLLAPARLALQAGSMAAMIFCLRDGYGRVRLECEEPFALPPLPRDSAERLRAEAGLALRYTRRIEEYIRTYPDQYLWMHKRWEKRPDTLPYPG